MSKWHCDGLSYIDVDGKVKIGMIPTYGRLVVSLDTFMRSNVDTNTSFIDGDFVVKNVVQTPEAKSVEELEFNDHNITTVTEGTGGILTINDTTFTPDQDKVRSFGMARINDIGSTTLHAAQELDDAMRVTLQCDYLLV